MFLFFVFKLVYCHIQRVQQKSESCNATEEKTKLGSVRLVKILQGQSTMPVGI